MSITLQTEGRRTYLCGNTYSIRDKIRAIGAHWDADRKAWWTSKRDAAEALVAKLPTAEPPAQASQSIEAQRDGLESVVAGRATYQGRTYYVAGRVVRGRTHWDDTVQAITTRDGQKVLLYFRDGSRQFWAPLARYTGAVVRVGDAPDVSGAEIVKTYDRPQTIKRLAKFAEEAKAGFPGRATCYMCGSPSCDGAHGGLCEHD